MNSPRGQTIRAALPVGATLLAVLATNVLVYPTRNIPIVYAVPLLIAALRLSPRGVLITAAFAVAFNLVSVGVERTPLQVWPATSLALLAICFGAYLLARQAEVTAQRTRELEAATSQLRSVGRVSDVALSHLNLDELLRELLGRVREILSSDTATILLLTEDGERLVVRASSGLEEEVQQHVEAPVGHGVAGQIVSSRKPLIVEDLSRVEVASPILRERVRSLAGVPLLVGGRAIGVLHVGTIAPRCFAQDDMRLLGLIAERAASGIERTRLYEAQLQARAEAERERDRARQSEDRLRLAQSGAQVGVWDWYPQTGELSFTPELELLYGLPPGSIRTYQDWRQRVHPDDLARIEAALNEAIANRQPFDLEFRILHASDEVRWIYGKSGALYDEAGQIVRVLGVNLDVTERKRAEADRARLAAVVESSGDAIIGKTLDGFIESWNRGAERLYGYTAEEVLGKPVSILVPPDHPDELPAILERIRRGEAVEPYETVRLRKLGGRVDVSITVSPIKDSAGRVVGASTIARDITEKKRAEALLARQAQELARSVAELEQFAYVASHDLQEPLRMVASYVQLLARRYQGKLDEDADEFIGFAVDGAKRMQGLINDLLAYSRVGSRGKPFEPAESEAVLGQALQNLQLAIEEGGAAVTHDPLPTVVADPTQLGQLFQNLIANAVKFHGSEPPRVHVSVEDRGSEWRFSVRDNGIGIAPEFHERIFLIFQRLHNREEYSGTGIGLAVCKKIVERHGGRIWVESGAGKGSTFHFTLPKRQAEEVAA